MAKTSLQVKAKNAATERATNVTITYVNPDADSATLKQFGQMLNGFTNNVYEETNRIQTINVDTEDTPKKAGSISTDITTERGQDTYIAISRDRFQTKPENAQIFGLLNINSLGTTTFFPIAQEGSSVIARYPSGTQHTGNTTWKLAIMGDNTYTAAAAEFTINMLS